VSATDPVPVDLVEAVRRLEYGRPSDRTVEAMLREGRGTCSAKHLYLAERLRVLLPDCEPQLVHRVYRIDSEQAKETFGERAAEMVPPEGVVDVHRYLVIRLNGKRTIIDATFPGPPWDGISDLPLACGPGSDHPSQGDPDAEKRQLEARYCDPVLREKFIAGLAGKVAS
jgi:hypothetical protein